MAEDTEYVTVDRLVDVIDRAIAQVAAESELMIGDVLVALGLVTGHFAELMADGEDEDDDDDASCN